MKPMTESHLATLRRHMVELVDLHFDLTEDETGRSAPDPALREAMLAVPRHRHVPAEIASLAYHDTPLPIGFDKTLSQPFIGALMLDRLALAPGQRVLEIGTGLGYQAALMAHMGAKVWSVEIVEEFAEAARQLLADAGYDVAIRVGDGSRGWAEHAPFDRILVTAAAAEPPLALLDQLTDDGLMVAPLGQGDTQQLSVVRRNGDGSAFIDPVMAVRFTRLETV